MKSFIKRKNNSNREIKDGVEAKTKYGGTRVSTDILRTGYYEAQKKVKTPRGGSRKELRGNVEEGGKTKNLLRKPSFVKKIQNHKESRDQLNQDDRVQELRDQNQYLMEKVHFLKMQKLRNENEVLRMDSNHQELRKMHDSYVSQLDDIETLITEWRDFHTSLTDVADTWSFASQQLDDSREPSDTSVDIPEVV